MASTLAPNPPFPGRSQGATPQPSRPPKSKTQLYYSVHPSWSGIEPIQQVDLNNPSTYTPSMSQSSAETLALAGPALATIAYTPRYTEAMAYLRAVMAINEKSQRALALTEDIIGMNPAHYTVWIYRFEILKGLWGLDDGEVGGDRASQEVVDGVEQELQWLEEVSERNLKNYQIWHHRTSLLSLLPSLPQNEPSFLTQILSLDTKNYHVWSYRQWLCTRFPNPLLTTPLELTATSQMITEDVLNNSAWNHRYFIVFGHQKSEIVDLDIVERELEYTKTQIRIAPQNGASWNYLKGILKVSGTEVTDMKDFCAEFVGDGFGFWGRDGDGGKKGVRSSQAIEMLVEIFDREGDKGRVRDGLRSLMDVWDPIRRRYWEFRLKKMEERWKQEDEEV